MGGDPTTGSFDNLGLFWIGQAERGSCDEKQTKLTSCMLVGVFLLSACLRLALSMPFLVLSLITEFSINIEYITPSLSLWSLTFSLSLEVNNHSPSWGALNISHGAEQPV